MTKSQAAAYAMALWTVVALWTACVALGTFLYLGLPGKPPALRAACDLRMNCLECHELP